MPTPAASASASQDGDVAADGRWIIRVGGIGPIEQGMTAEDAAVVLSVADIEPWFANQLSPACAVYVLGTDGSAGTVHVVAVSAGGRGPIDLLIVYAFDESDPLVPITAEGLTVGASLDAVLAVYGDRAEISTAEDGTSSLMIADGDSALAFSFEADRVVEISTGTLQAVQGFGECA